MKHFADLDVPTRTKVAYKLCEIDNTQSKAWGTPKWERLTFAKIALIGYIAGEGVIPATDIDPAFSYDHDPYVRFYRACNMRTLYRDDNVRALPVLSALRRW